MIKKFLAPVIIFALMMSSALAAPNKLLLTLDGVPHARLPRHFRTTDNQQQLKASNISVAGLASLHAIGSGQFSLQQLKLVVKKIAHPIIVIDLRQESHGFVNGIPISWYGIKNWANYGKSDNQIRATETNLLNKTKAAKQIVVYSRIKKTKDGYVSGINPAQLKVKTVANEKDVVKSLGLNYHRFFVPDHSKPSDQQVDQFIQFIRKSPKDVWLYFHCRAGIGRTTTFMVMYDIMENAKSVSLHDILAREKMLGGKDLTLPAQGYKRLLAKQRINFIRKFYQYCRENADDFKTSWTTWLGKRNEMEISLFDPLINLELPSFMTWHAKARRVRS